MKKIFLTILIAIAIFKVTNAQNSKQIWMFAVSTLHPSNEAEAIVSNIFWINEDCNNWQGELFKQLNSDFAEKDKTWSINNDVLGLGYGTTYSSQEEAQEARKNFIEQKKSFGLKIYEIGMRSWYTPCKNSIKQTQPSGSNSKKTVWCYYQSTNHPSKNKEFVITNVFQVNTSCTNWKELLRSIMEDLFVQRIESSNYWNNSKDKCDLGNFTSYATEFEALDARAWVIKEKKNDGNYVNELNLNKLFEPCK